MASDAAHPVVDNETAALGAAWHPVAEATELGDEPLGVMLLGEAWVLARLGGEVVAFEDRCPHRRAPLSAGWVEGGQLRCGYHGWAYGADGRCTLIPADGPDRAIPPRACLRRPAGVVERYGLVWLAPTEPVCDLHPFPEWDDPTFDRSWTPPRRTPAGAAQLADSVLAASPLPAAPATGSGASSEPAVRGRGPVERDGWEVRAVDEAPLPGPAGLWAAAGLDPLAPRFVLTKVGRPAAVVRVTLDDPLTGDRLTVLFACQPETRDSTRVYKLMARSGGRGDRHGDDELGRCESMVLEEDRAVLDRDGGHALPVGLPDEVPSDADRLSVGYRRLLADLVALQGGVRVSLAGRDTRPGRRVHAAPLA